MRNTMEILRNTKELQGKILVGTTRGKYCLFQISHAHRETPSSLSRAAPDLPKAVRTALPLAPRVPRGTGSGGVPGISAQPRASQKLGNKSEKSALSIQETDPRDPSDLWGAGVRWDSLGRTLSETVSGLPKALGDLTRMLCF